jgi:hypothetical protein
VLENDDDRAKIARAIVTVRQSSTAVLSGDDASPIFLKDLPVIPDE